MLLSGSYSTGWRMLHLGFDHCNPSNGPMWAFDGSIWCWLHSWSFYGLPLALARHEAILQGCWCEKVGVQTQTPLFWTFVRVCPKDTNQSTTPIMFPGWKLPGFYQTYSLQNSCCYSTAPNLPKVDSELGFAISWGPRWLQKSEVTQARQFQTTSPEPSVAGKNALGSMARPWSFGWTPKGLKDVVGENVLWANGRIQHQRL